MNEPIGLSGALEELSSKLGLCGFILKQRPLCEVGTCMKPSVRIVNLSDSRNMFAVCEDHRCGPLPQDLVGATYNDADNTEWKSDPPGGEIRLRDENVEIYND